MFDPTSQRCLWLQAQTRHTSLAEAIIIAHSTLTATTASTTAGQNSWSLMAVAIQTGFKAAHVPQIQTALVPFMLQWQSAAFSLTDLMWAKALAALCYSMHSIHQKGLAAAD